MAKGKVHPGVAEDLVVRLPTKDFAAEDVYTLSLRWLKWFLITQKIGIDMKFKAVQMGLRLRPEDEKRAEKVEHDVDKLMHQVFGEGLLKAVGDE